MLRYCTPIVGAARAEDVVQQALINAHAALRRTSEVRHLRSWLYRITHNAALNALRSVRDDLPLDPAHAAADGPEAALERTERLRATLAAVQDLPERQRAALLLRELEGRSHEEIASALGVTTGAARQSLVRARTAVRAAVTAITPYPLIARLAEWTMARPGAPGWGEAAATAGAGATLAKLTAGVMATGALVGAGFGAGHALTRDRPEASDARVAPAVTHRSAATTAAAVVAPAVVRSPATSVVDPAPRATRGGTGAHQQGSVDRHRGGGRGHDHGRHGNGHRAGGSGSAAREHEPNANDGRNDDTAHTRGPSSGDGGRSVSRGPSPASSHETTDGRGGPSRSGGSGASGASSGFGGARGHDVLGVSGPGG